jgi:hypothetical protein
LHNNADTLSQQISGMKFYHDFFLQSLEFSVSNRRRITNDNFCNFRRSFTLNFQICFLPVRNISTSNSIDISLYHKNKKKYVEVAHVQEYGVT